MGPALPSAVAQPALSSWAPLCPDLHHLLPVLTLSVPSTRPYLLSKFCPFLKA